MAFEPDYRHFAEVIQNRRPSRMPFYEHVINAPVMEEILGLRFGQLEAGDSKDLAEFFRNHCRFFRAMTYDTVSYEVCLGGTLPGSIAICGGKGPIQSRSDFDSYPWKELPEHFWEIARPRLDALSSSLPPGMKAVGGIGNGVFELAESLVGLEYLPYMEADDPELYVDLFRAIGDLMCATWLKFMPRYGKDFAACRFGDDLGFKSSLLTSPGTVREHVLPQYRRVIDIIHSGGRPFLWHSCGCIFEIMEDVIALRIDAKHSNEDTIAPFDRWIEDYGNRIALLGGFDIGFLSTESPAVIHDAVLESGRRFRKNQKGYALGSGNSIPGYIPAENYLAMIRAGQALRMEEKR